jgi:hypothetical protein
MINGSYKEHQELERRRSYEEENENCTPSSPLVEQDYVCDSRTVSDDFILRGLSSECELLDYANYNFHSLMGHRPSCAGLKNKPKKNRNKVKKKVKAQKKARKRNRK